MNSKIITVPNPLLRQKSKPVKMTSSRGRPASGWDKKIKKVISILIKAVQMAKEPKGVGLSAVQIGKPVRIFVIKHGKEFIPFINPKITWRSKKMLSQVLKKEELFLEGCLSLPHYYGFVNRPYTVKLEWQNLEGKKHQGKFEGKESGYVQHEYDHLEGILFVDRILKQGGKIYKLEKDENKEETLVEIKLA